MFGHGNAAPPYSQWAKRKTSIDSCPVKKAPMDIFGNLTTCKRGFHRVLKCECQSDYFELC